MIRFNMIRFNMIRFNIIRFNMTTLILGDFNAHHPSWYARSTDTRGRKMADLFNGSDYGILNWDSPMLNRVH